MVASRSLVNENSVLYGTIMEKVLTRREENREARRAAIVAIARDAFLDHGYAATSMSTIAGQLGGSKGTLWAYFPSKEDLFAAVLDDVTASFRQSLDDTLRPDRDWHMTLRDFAQRFLMKMLNPDSMRLHRLIIGESGRFPEIGQIFFARGPRIVMERLADYLRGRMDAGDLRPVDPMEAAMTLVQLTQLQHNLRLWGIIGLPDPAEIEAHADTVVDLFARAYGV